MKASSRADLVVAACLCGVIGLYDLVYVVFVLSRGPSIGPKLNVLFPDFLVFWAAAHAWIEGKLGLVYSLDAFTAYQNTLFADRVPGQLYFRPFLYPPIWFLALLPFGYLAVAKAYGLFVAAGAALATVIQGRRDRWGWLAVVASPASVWVVLAGQNTYFSVALFYAGFHALDRSPATAGILLGLLAYKPQIWALVPIALLAARQWRALAWAVGTVAALVLTSIAAFGWQVWPTFFAAARQAASPSFVNEMFERMYMHMTTLLAAARLLGLSEAASGAIQVAGAGVAVTAVWLAFRRAANSEARLAVLATATFLVSPYTLNYDLLLLLPAAVLMFRQAVAEGFYPFERLVLFLLWTMPTVGMVLNRLDLPLMPVVILAFGWFAWKRLGALKPWQIAPASAFGRKS